jgi:hypothetical protein
MKTVSTLLVILASLSFAASGRAQEAKTALRAGAAASVITPPLGEMIVGGFTPFPAEHIHDELHARCLVLDDGETKVALVICDLLGLHRSVAVEAKALIDKELGIPGSHVVISRSPSAISTCPTMSSTAAGSSRREPCR